MFADWRQATSTPTLLEFRATLIPGVTPGPYPPRSKASTQPGIDPGVQFGCPIGCALFLTTVIVAVVLAIRSSPFVFVGGGLLLVGFFAVAVALGKRLDRFPEERVHGLPLAHVAREGEVAVFEGEVRAGGAGTIVAPLTKRPCVWAILQVEREKRHVAIPFRLDDGAGQVVEVDPHEGDIHLFPTRANMEANETVTEETKRATVEAMGIEPPPRAGIFERLVEIGDRVTVVGVVRRVGEDIEYRGARMSILASDDRTGVALFPTTRHALKTAFAPDDVRPWLIRGAVLIAAATVTLVLSVVIR